MFTGIVAGTSPIKTLETGLAGGREARMVLDLAGHSDGLAQGDSVAVNGVCLTVAKIQNRLCTFEMISETLSRTNLGRQKPGGLVNIERSLAVGDRLEGHFVLGHVDGTGTITSMQHLEGETRMRVRLPRELMPYVAQKGSITLDGISLTVSDADADTITVCLIPHTVQITNMADKMTGDTVNVETDILAKYIRGAAVRN